MRQTRNLPGDPEGGLEMKKRFGLALALALTAVMVMPALAFGHTSTKLYASINTPYEHYQAAPSLLGTLKTSSGRALAYKYVSLYYNGSKVTTGKTNRYGKVRFSLRLDGQDMSAIWQLRYAGSSTYAKCSSPYKKTHMDIHYMSVNEVPWPYDSDDDQVIDSWVIDPILTVPDDYRLLGIATSVPTVREVWDFPGYSTNSYLSDDPAEYGEVQLDPLQYEFDIWCPNALPISVLIW